MFNAVRMDIYRLIHTKSAYVILVIAMALAIAMSGMTALVRSMAAESIVETTDEVTMVSESDSEIADEYDTASVESSNGPTATVGLEVDNSDMSDEVPTIADMVESDIAGLDLALLLAIFTVLFSTADLNSGYIKSVGGQVKFACVDGPEFDGHLVDFDQAMQRQQSYKTQEGRAMLKLQEGSTHHGGCGNCGGDR